MAAPKISMRNSGEGAAEFLQEVKLAQDLDAADHDDRGEHDPELAAHAAEHDDREDRRRIR